MWSNKATSVKGGVVVGSANLNIKRQPIIGRVVSSGADYQVNSHSHLPFNINKTVHILNVLKVKPWSSEVASTYVPTKSVSMKVLSKLVSL